jgi:SAM-dependent methyltransferase
MDAEKINELDRIAIGYDPSNPAEFFDYWFKRFEADAVEPWLAGRNILELGGATGESAMLISPNADRYVIVEGSPINCEMIRKRLPHVEVIEAFWENYSPNEKFTDIVLFETLEHYSDPVSLLSRCRRWLAPGGRIHVSVPNGESLHRQVAVRMGLQPTAIHLSDSDRSQGHLRNYTLDSLVNHITSAGLRSIHERGLFMKLVPNKMMLTWDETLLWAINDLAEKRIQDAAELFVVCEVV